MSSEIIVKTVYGNVVVTFLDLARVRVESRSYGSYTVYPFQIATTHIFVDLYLENNNDVWNITHNRSHKHNSKQFMLHNDLPTKINDKLEIEIKKVILPVIKENRKALLEAEKYQTEIDLSTATREVEDLEPKLKAAIKQKLQLEQKLANLINELQ